MRVRSCALYCLSLSNFFLTSCSPRKATGVAPVEEYVCMLSCAPCPCGGVSQARQDMFENVGVQSVGPPSATGAWQE